VLLRPVHFLKRRKKRCFGCARLWKTNSGDVAEKSYRHQLSKTLTAQRATKTEGRKRALAER